MAVYHKDDPNLLRLALESVYANSLPPNAVVLVQDGPIGEVLQNVIGEYERRQDFHIIKLPNNKGLATALNAGLQYITTRYVFRADSDDYNLPDRFERQMAALSSGYDLVGGSIMEVDKAGKSIAIRTVPTSQDEIRRFMSKRNPFNHMTVAFQLSAVVKLGGYPDINLKEDYALWVLMLSSGAKMININEILVHATTGRDMYKRRGGLKYAYSEIDMQYFLVSHGIQSIFGAFIIGLSRSLVFLLPAFFRGFIYEKLLRKSI